MTVYVTVSLKTFVTVYHVTVYVTVYVTAYVTAYVTSLTCPQFLQWCFLLMRENGSLHRAQLVTALSGTHSGASEERVLVPYIAYTERVFVHNLHGGRKI